MSSKTKKSKPVKFIKRENNNPKISSLKKTGGY